MPIIQLWVLENRTTINVSDQNQKKVLAKLKVELLQSKIEEQKVNEKSDDDNTKTFDFIIKRKNREVKLGIM